MKDVAGRKLSVGDVVSYTTPDYKDLNLGVIVNFSHRKLRIKTARLLHRGSSNAHVELLDEKQSTLVYPSTTTLIPELKIPEAISKVLTK